jgi:ATP-binding cassette subfamily F protein uup
MLNARNLKLSYGNRVILDDVSFSLLPNERIALVGQNGVGKSTVLRLLAGEPPDSGAIEVNKQTKIGFLKQIPDLDENKTVLDIVRSGMSEHLEAISQHQLLCDELMVTEAGHEREKKIKKLEELAYKIERQGGFDVDHWVERVLTLIGVKAREQKICSLSGGEKRRVDLARILLSAPDIYLLDEPTNHLDMNAIQFLAESFSKMNAALLFVSHDVRFIDELATRIIELSQGKMFTHNLPFSNYLENKLVRELIDERRLHRKERLVVGELAWLRAGTPARTTKQNARIDRAHELIEQVAKDTDLLRKQRIQIEIGKSQRLGKTIVELEAIGANFGKRVLFKDFSLKVTSGKRYGILGPNGCGKTTLLSIIANKIEPSSGHIIYGKNTHVLEFDQQREQLNKDATLKETLADYGDYVHVDGRNLHISLYLEKYLFSAEDANRRVDTLSGGEHNRLLLAKLFRRRANCLLLDEPTNDLDVESLAVLEETLLDYDGVIFTVSHDRKFLDRICNSIIAFEQPGLGAESGLVVCPGNYSDYLHLRDLEKERLKQVAEKDKPEKHREKTRVKRRRSYREEQEFQEIENVIEKLELERADLQKELSSGEVFREDGGKKYLKQLQWLDEEIEKLYARWQELMDMGGS